MKRSISVVIAALVIVGAGRASAQDVTAGPGTVEITAIPGGGTFFTSRHSAPSFGNYTLGGALTYNINPIVGLEGEVSGAFGVSQDLAFGGITTNQKSPSALNYAADVVVSAPTHSPVVPYVAGGVGGLTMYERAGLGIDGTQTFLTGNVGGGVKWYAGRWGLRADYRFIGVRSNDNAPAFFGKETRYGHRIYGAVLLNVGQ